jgi:hypothetical protein
MLDGPTCYDWVALMLSWALEHAESRMQGALKLLAPRQQLRIITGAAWRRLTPESMTMTAS